jgi:hypothetical protein
MTPQEIRDAIAASPELQAMQTAGDHQGIADTLSAGRKKSKLGSVATTEFASWAGGTGMRAVIEDKSAAAGDPLRSSALALRDVLLGGMSGIRFDYPQNVSMLDAWVAMGALTEANKASLLALAMVDDPVSFASVTEAIKGA